MSRHDDPWSHQRDVDQDARAQRREDHELIRDLEDHERPVEGADYDAEEPTWPRRRRRLRRHPS